MQLTLSLILVSIGLVAAGKTAWKEGKEYQYNLRFYMKTNKETGTAAQALLTIVPQRDNLLIGKISNAIYGNTNAPFPGDGSDLNGIMPKYDEWKLNGQQFKINLVQDHITSLSVDPSLTSNEINQLRAIVSQLQVSTSPKSSYKIMEPTIFGMCQTAYDISPLSSYSHPAQGVENLIQIEKTRNCGDSTPAARTRIVISGDLNEYTIQSVYATSAAADSYEHIGITIESVRESANYGEILLDDRSLTVEGIELINDRRFEKFAPENVGSCEPAPNAEEQITPTCWTGFVDPDAQCKNDFDAQWTSVGGAGCCGVLCLGQKQRCRKSFPGCVETVCYAAAQSAASACTDQYKAGDYPIPCGGSTNCAPGWRRVRCCPKKYA